MNVAPMAFEYLSPSWNTCDTSMPRALDAAELPGIVQDYRHAARNAIACGFDGVEIHAANGYLLEQFLKTGANQRSDDYGGSLKNRSRLLLEVVRAIADEIGAARTGIRLSPVTPANDIADENPQKLFDYLMHQLGPLGLAYVHIIEGATGGARTLPEQPFDYAQAKALYRAAGGGCAPLGLARRPPGEHGLPLARDEGGGRTVA